MRITSYADGFCACAHRRRRSTDLLSARRGDMEENDALNAALFFSTPASTLPPPEPASRRSEGKRPRSPDMEPMQQDDDLDIDIGATPSFEVVFGRALLPAVSMQVSEMPDQSLPLVQGGPWRFPTA